MWTVDEPQWRYYRREEGGEKVEGQLAYLLYRDSTRFAEN